MNDNDRIALQMLRNGGSGTNSRSFRHYLYFPAQDDAMRLAVQLRKAGLHVESRLGGDSINWLVLIRHTLVGDDALEQSCEQFETLAEEFNGEYDGWEAEDQPT